MGSRVDAEWLVLTVVERFHLVRWLSFSPGGHPRPYLRPEWEQGMLEAALRSLLSIAALRHVVGAPEVEVVKLELATVLAHADASHSELMDAIPRDRESSHIAQTLDPAQLLPQVPRPTRLALE